MNNKVCRTIYDKVMLIKEFEESGISKAAFAKKHNLARTSLGDILSSKEKLLDSLETYNGCKRRRLRKSNFEAIETELFKWVRVVKAQNIPLSGIILKEKAIEIAKQLGNYEFSGSNGWLERFKDRHGLSFKKMSSKELDFWFQNLASMPAGEPSEADSSSMVIVSVDEWKNTVLKYVVNQYQPSDIYNLIETRLFYDALPETPLRSIKNKDQMVVLLGANVTGTDKLKPLVISNNLLPKCFENINMQSLPVTYRFNPEMCISFEVWLETIKELDRLFLKEKRKIAVIVDNYALMTRVQGLRAVELILLPPNVASVFRHLSKEIIRNFKTNYRKFLLRDWISAIDDNRTFSPTILDAVQYIFKSWRNVDAGTVQNCFRNAGFLIQYHQAQGTHDATGKEKNVSLTQLFEEVTKRGKVLEMDEKSYLKIDNKIFIDSNNSTPQQTVFEVASDTNNCVSENAHDVLSEWHSKFFNGIPESDTEKIVEKPPSKQDALDSFNVIKKYLLSVEGTTLQMHECLYQIEESIINNHSENNQT